MKNAKEPQAQFEEIGRWPIPNSSSQLCLSRVKKGGKVVGFSLNRWVETAKYTGHTKGQLIPKSLVAKVVAAMS
jgi:hypothetical protein